MLLGSLAFSLAFNMSWAWGGSPLSVIAAAACTLIVPAGLHLWPLVPAANWKIRALRAVVMSGICSAAAVVSFLHAVDVLFANGWTPITAWAVTGGAELLVALSTMALRQPVRTEPEPVAEHTERAVPTHVGQVHGQAETAAEQVVDTPPVQDRKPVRRPSRKLSAVKADHADDFLKWALELDERPSTYAVRQRFQCGHDKALALLGEFDRVAGSEAVS